MMNSRPLSSNYKQRVELALIHHLGARGESLRARIHDVVAELPEDLTRLLYELDGDQLDGGADADFAVADYAFRCGQAVERIENLARARAADDLIFTDTAGNPVTDPAGADLAMLSRFRVARDRFLRKAADFSLKLLVTAVGLLLLGFLLGVI